MFKSFGELRDTVIYLVTINVAQIAKEAVYATRLTRVLYVKPPSSRVYLPADISIIDICVIDRNHSCKYDVCSPSKNTLRSLDVSDGNVKRYVIRSLFRFTFESHNSCVWVRFGLQPA